jgi:chaperonin cofactor prefoldin
VYEAQQRADDLIERKSQIERRLKEFIAVERELIKNYESEEE